ncbi:Glucosamine-phosphate N-acetyltransferase-like protein [Sorochytrium milnesiophthora]
MDRSTLIDPATQSALPEGYILRELQAGDYDKGYLDLLAQLTVTGNFSRQQFEDQVEYITKRNDTYCVIVIEDLHAKRVVAAGTVLLERKFIHSCGVVAHIEDIVVDKDQRGLKFGLRIINALVHIAKQYNAYKTILDCSESNVGFYEKCGFTKKAVEMALYHTEDGKPHA